MPQLNQVRDDISSDPTRNDAVLTTSYLVPQLSQRTKKSPSPKKKPSLTLASIKGRHCC